MLPRCTLIFGVLISLNCKISNRFFQISEQFTPTATTTGRSINCWLFVLVLLLFFFYLCWFLGGSSCMRLAASKTTTEPSERSLQTEAYNFWGFPRLPQRTKAEDAAAMLPTLASTATATVTPTPTAAATATATSASMLPTVDHVWDSLWLVAAQWMKATSTCRVLFRCLSHKWPLWAFWTWLWSAAVAN